MCYVSAWSASSVKCVFLLAIYYVLSSFLSAKETNLESGSEHEWKALKWESNVITSLS